MPKGLRRFHHPGDWHFITCSCYRRQKFLDWVRRRDLFLDILEEVRAKYDFVVAGYVVIHPAARKPRVAKLSRAMQVLKQRVSLRYHGKKRKNATPMRLWDEAAPRAFWQPRYYDFNVFTQRKYIEKLRYIHRNPVKRGLVASPELWRWSSFHDYWLGERGKVKIGNWRCESTILKDPPFAPSAKSKTALSAKDGAPALSKGQKRTRKGGPPVHREKR